MPSPKKHHCMTFQHNPNCTGWTLSTYCRSCAGKAGIAARAPEAVAKSLSNARSVAKSLSNQVHTPRPRSKFGNVPCEQDGFKFDSKAERTRYIQLVALMKAGEISNLTCEKKFLKFPLHVGGIKICDYEADFKYTNTATGKVVVEDVKGVRTAVYNIKKKLMLAVHGITIKERKA